MSVCFFFLKLLCTELPWPPYVAVFIIHLFISDVHLLQLFSPTVQYVYSMLSFLNYCAAEMSLNLFKVYCSNLFLLKGLGKDRLRQKTPFFT